MREGWEFTGLEEWATAEHILCQRDCRDYHSSLGDLPASGFCNATWDGFLCWAATAPGTVAKQLCPKNIKGILKDNLAIRHCSQNGYWLGENGQETVDPSWTNFTGCFEPELTKLIVGFYSNISDSEAEAKTSVLYYCRIFEMVGYSISFASILLSLCILTGFRKLRTNEKRIHRHLYLAMLIQVVIRLILYTDQFVSRQGGVIGDLKASSDNIHSSTQDHVKEVKGIDNTPYLCESFYVLLEYARSAMFHWFFIEGLHLHNVLTINVFPSHNYRLIYYVLGWGVPVLMTTIWAVVTSVHMKADCWYGYNHTDYYYIVEGPRLAVIAVNLLFLLNILRVLLTKLKNVNSSETVKVRKALKAAIVLQPLLGITNSLQMMSTPYDRSLTYFALWSFLTTFLVSFQGFFAALFYCFLNGEVRAVLAKYFERQATERALNRRASSLNKKKSKQLINGAVSITQSPAAPDTIAVAHLDLRENEAGLSECSLNSHRSDMRNALAPPPSLTSQSFVASPRTDEPPRETTSLMNRP